MRRFFIEDIRIKTRYVVLDTHSRYRKISIIVAIRNKKHGPRVAARAGTGSEGRGWTRGGGGRGKKHAIEVEEIKRNRAITALRHVSHVVHVPFCVVHLQCN